jgi:hypothetical protein
VDEEGKGADRDWDEKSGRAEEAPWNEILVMSEITSYPHGACTMVPNEIGLEVGGLLVTATTAINIFGEFLGEKIF